MSSSTVRVNLGPRSYDIAIGSDCLAGVGPFARERARGTFAMIVTDGRVQHHADEVDKALAAAGFKTEKVLLPDGESTKSLSMAGRLFDRLIELHADRQTLMVAVGGGVMGDLTGFVAATFNRGVPLLQVPTTLLAMVDSSVGGKVGVNHPKAKNVIGAFHQPVGVWIHTDVLNTLRQRDFRSGLAEVVKYGVILDAELFAWLEANKDLILERDPAAMRHIVARCCRLKADVVEKDEREETGLRAVLNYGHTFAHAFEKAGKYKTWLHGEAVSAGMACASVLAERHGLLGPELGQRQQALLQHFVLPVYPEHWPIDDLIDTMRSDKKSVAGQMRFILPRRLGEVALFDDVPESLVREVLDACCKKHV